MFRYVLFILFNIFYSLNLKAYNFIRLGLSSPPTGLLDETVIYFDSAASDNYDENFDALKMIGTANATLFTRSADNADLSINVLGSFVKNIEIPLIISSNSDDFYDICVLNFDESIDPTTSIYIEDRLTGKIYNFREIVNMSFFFKKGLSVDRLYIHFLLPLSFDIKPESCFLDDGSISISNMSINNPWDIKLFNYNGSLVKSAFGVTQEKIILSNLSGGEYKLELGSLYCQSTLIPFKIENGVQVISDFCVPSYGKTYSKKPIKLIASHKGSFTFNWDMGDGSVFFGDSVIEYVYEMPGIYTVTLLVSDGICYDVSQQTIAVILPSDIITSLKKDKSSLKTLTLYPTITREEITVQVSNMKVENVKIIDLLGRIVYEQFVYDASIYDKPVKIWLNNLSSGYYFFIINGENKNLMKRFYIY